MNALVPKQALEKIFPHISNQKILQEVLLRAAWKRNEACLLDTDGSAD